MVTNQVNPEHAETPSAVEVAETPAVELVPDQSFDKDSQKENQSNSERYSDNKQITDILNWYEKG